MLRTHPSHPLTGASRRRHGSICFDRRELGSNNPAPSSSLSRTQASPEASSSRRLHARHAEQVFRARWYYRPESPMMRCFENNGTPLLALLLHGGVMVKLVAASRFFFKRDTSPHLLHGMRHHLWAFVNINNANLRPCLPAARTMSVSLFGIKSRESLYMMPSATADF